MTGGATPMRVVHFGKYYFPDAGGIETVTVSLARGAAAAGHDVEVVCFARDGAPGRQRLDGVEVVRVAASADVASQPLGWGYLAACRRRGRAADVIHLHAPNMLGALAALLVGPRPRLLVHWHSDVLNKGRLGRLTRPLERAMLRRADAIVTTSPVYADASTSLRGFLGKVEVVPIGVPDVRADGASANGGDATPGPAATDALPDGLARRIGRRRIVLAVGRLVPYKGFEVLVRAAAALADDTVVVIVGAGPLRASLEAQIDAAGAATRVVLAGRVDDAGLRALFARATLYCLPSIDRAEAFGVVMLEAMAHGVPIVASDIAGSGVPWVNRDGVSGLNVPPGDAAALARACNRLLLDEPARAGFARGARSRFVEEFTESRAVERMLALYRRLAASGPRAR